MYHNQQHYENDFHVKRFKEYLTETTHTDCHSSRAKLKKRV
jgi:hypothetical protein